MADAEEPVAGGPGWRNKVDQLWAWRADMTEEVARLPQTLAHLRATTSDLRRVSSRLEGSTEGLEVLLRRAESSGIAPMARRLDAAATEVESQLREIQAQLPGGATVNRAIDELENAFRAFAALLPTPKPKPEAESDGG
ncbi:MAG: hypothetical protein ACC660_02845 [Acidimicrobiales bacterium]